MTRARPDTVTLAAYAAMLLANERITLQLALGGALVGVVYVGELSAGISDPA